MGTVDTAFVNQFRDMITHALQQKASKLRASCLVDTNFVGEHKYYDQLGATEMVEKTTRNQDTPSLDPDHTRRRLDKKDFIHNVLFDKEDQLNMLIDPKSAYSQTALYAAGRQMDDEIVTALGGTSYSGKAGATSVTFPSAQKVAHGDAGLTVNKLIAAKVLLDNADVPEDDRFCLCTANQISDLLKTDEATSFDYNSIKALVSGAIDTFLGFKFISIGTARLPELATNYRGVYCFHKGAIQLGIQKEASVNIDQRPDKNYAWQVFLSMSIGATRLEEARAVQISCLES